MNILGAYILGVGAYKTSKTIGNGFAYLMMFMLVLVFFFTIPLGLIISSASKKEKIQNLIEDFLPNKRGDTFYSSALTFSWFILGSMLLITVALFMNKELNLSKDTIPYTLLGFSIFSIILGFYYMIKENYLGNNIIGIYEIIQDPKINDILNSNAYTTIIKIEKLEVELKKKNINVEYQISFLNQIKHLLGVKVDIQKNEFIDNKTKNKEDIQSKNIKKDCVNQNLFVNFDEIKSFFTDESKKYGFTNIWQNDEFKLIIKRESDYIQVRKFDNYIDLMIFVNKKVLLNQKMETKNNSFYIDMKILSILE